MGFSHHTQSLVTPGHPLPGSVLTATAAATGYQQQPATAHNARTMRASWGYVRPEKQTVEGHRGFAATVAQVIVSFSHPGRCRSESALAALAGTSPLPASSGQTIRHRLNRGGDRALNRAIHTIALIRMRSCPRTRAYVARRTAEGKTIREIRRCLKRYIARELYRHLTQTMNPPVDP
jgi:Transposase IS116/IS110/IS902 family